nr:phosphotransferase [Tessaracoccus sp. OS52]
MAARLVADLGGELEDPGADLKAYRPTRRAVIEVNGRGDHRLYLKLVKPDRLESLRRRHDELCRHLPVPEPLGVQRELGLLVMPSMRGATLREALEAPGEVVPSPEVVVGLTGRIPELSRMGEVTSSIEAAPRMADLLTHLLPAQHNRITSLLGRIGSDLVTERVVAHGDYHEAQLLVDGGAVVGLLDVDTVGWARPADDAAVMLAHLSVWSAMSSRPQRVRAYALELQRLWDRQLDPVDLRRRVAARLLALAVGPFRAQVDGWPLQTSLRLDLVEGWLDSADAVA